MIDVLACPRCGSSMHVLEFSLHLESVRDFIPKIDVKTFERLLFPDNERRKLIDENRNFVSRDVLPEKRQANKKHRQETFYG